MRLNEQLVFPQARVKKIEVQISAEDPKIKVTMRAPLTQEVCSAFGCRDIIYAGDVPRSGVEKIVLEGEQVDVEMHLKNNNLGFYAVCNSIGEYVAKMEGTGPVLEFKLCLTGFAELVVDLATKVKIDPLELTLKPAQIPIELHDGPCTSCNNSVPFAVAGDESGFTEDLSRHVNGQPCAKFKRTPEPAEEPKGPTLAPAVLAGGTHQAKKRGRPPKAAAAAAVAPEQPPFAGDDDDKGEVIN
jgi:hypothetical protein